MKNDDKKIIYVGKAKNLKKRVHSYFNRKHEDEKTINLVKNIADIEIIMCNSELDAFVLENNLIKKYSPKYNILLKDEKTYPYIKITKETFPKIEIVRKIRDLNAAKGICFGPYPSGAFQLMKTLIKLFKIRDCNLNMEKVQNRPCLKYYMGTCLAPCKFKNIETEYGENINNALKVLKGQGKSLLKDLQAKMEDASKKMDFEKAIIYREQKNEIERTINNQVAEYGQNLDEDVFTFAQDGNVVFICVINMREGKVLGKISLKIKTKTKISYNLFESVVGEFYSNRPVPKNIIFEPEYIEEKEIIESWLKIKTGRVVHTHFPKASSRRSSFLNMALLNLDKDIVDYYNKKSTIESGMAMIYQALELKNYPRVIECFDISNIQGKDAVASMTVSVEGKAAPQRYRKFKIRCKDTPDDFEMMREVIRRRYSKLEPKDFPDVILIDGGIGQINAAGEVLKSIGKEGIADLLSLAEKEELIYKYGNNEPFAFSHSEEGLKIFIRVRDEAHRFAITYHRKLRMKRVVSSELEKIKGIGDVRREKLLKHFGSVKKIQEASLEELELLIPKKVAILLKEQLNKSQD